MTILIPVGRSWSAKVLLPRSSPLTRLLSTKSHTRVATSQPTRTLPYRPRRSSAVLSPPLQLQQVRTLAAEAGRPKSHTGRSTSGKQTATKKAASKSKAKPKKAAKAKSKATKAKSKATKAKSKATKAKAKPKKRELTEAGKKRKEAAERTKLKKQALLRGAPKALPENAWTVFFVERGPKKGEALDKSGSRTKATAQEYRNISAEERERLNHIASQNKAKNEAAYKEWVQSYTPLEIKHANHARDLLKQDAKKHALKGSFPHIKDDRLVKQPLNQFSLFLKDRFASGDFRGLSITEAGKVIGNEWKDLSPTDKKAYDERFAVERSRYQEEYKSVYGIESPSVNSSPSPSASP